MDSELDIYADDMLLDREFDAYEDEAFLSSAVLFEDVSLDTVE